MSESLLWRIGSPDGRSPDLVDNYRDPAHFGEATWIVGKSDQRWPLFHASEADPDGHYRPYIHTVRFALTGSPSPAYRLTLHVLAIAPRLGHLEITINGVAGRVYLRLQPSTSGDILLQPGLHAAIYAEGTTEVIVPGELLRVGDNTLTLRAIDGGAFTRIDRREKIARLDRMATGAGFIYRGLEWRALSEAPVDSVQAHIEPSVIYIRTPDGSLRERCHLHIETTRALSAADWSLELTDDSAPRTLTVPVPGLAFGHWRFLFDIADGYRPVKYRLRGPTGRGDAGVVDAAAEIGAFTRRRKWQVYITPHAHTDVGYTHRQWEAVERMSRNLDVAVDWLREHPKAFAYHLDSSIALDHYLSTRAPDRAHALLDQVHAGRLGVPTNTIIPLTHLAALEDLIRNGEASEDVLRPLGRSARFAAIVDVPSLTSALPSILQGSGVPYLIHAANQDRGPLRLHGGLHRHSPFYWQGPHGGLVLVWLSKMYCELRKVCGSPPDLSAAERGLGLWLDEFETPGYAPDMVLLYGQEADNTDLDPQPIDFTSAWNDRYAYPRLVPSNVESFFADVEARFGKHLTTITGDGGAFWEDGAGSTQDATRLARQAQATLPAAERLSALAMLHQPRLAVPQADFDEAWKQVLLFDEHTWGAFLSATDPDAILQRDQWAVKEDMAREAAARADRLLLVAIVQHSLSFNTSGREVVVFNPHNWPLGGSVQVEVARGEEVFDFDTGLTLPARLKRELTTQAWLELDPGVVPGLSYKRFGLRGASGDTQSTAFAEPLPTGDEITLENMHYRLVIDARRGCAVSWRDKALDRELIAADEWGLGQLVQASGGEGTRLISNHASLPAGDPQLTGAFRLMQWETLGDTLGERVRLIGKLPQGALDVEWELPRHDRRVDLTFTWHKDAQLALEAAYVAFPLDLPGARVRSDAQLGWVDWSRDRLPGACVEWLPLQSGILLDGDGASVFIASPDVPLFCVGDVVRGRWLRDADLTGGRIFSYALNNYWRTNYKASQGGTLQFRYALTSDAAIAPDEAFRFGAAARRPLIAHRISLQEFRSPGEPYANTLGGMLARVEPETVHLSTLKRSRWARGYVARFQEIGGDSRVARLVIPGRPIVAAWETDLLERERHSLDVEADGSLRVEVPAWGLTTVRFEVAS